MTYFFINLFKILFFLMNVLDSLPLKQIISSHGKLKDNVRWITLSNMLIIIKL